MDLVIVEKSFGLAAPRSIRTDNRPPCTTSASTKIVPGGPPRHPPGMSPLGDASKLRDASNSARSDGVAVLGSCAFSASATVTQRKINRGRIIRKPYRAQITECTRHIRQPLHLGYVENSFECRRQVAENAINARPSCLS